MMNIVETRFFSVFSFFSLFSEKDLSLDTLPSFVNLVGSFFKYQNILLWTHPGIFCRVPLEQIWAAARRGIVDVKLGRLVRLATNLSFKCFNAGLPALDVMHISQGGNFICQKSDKINRYLENKSEYFVRDR